MKTYEQVIAELDALGDEFTLLKRDNSSTVQEQLTHIIDSFLLEKLGDAYSIESEYVWYSMVSKYSNIYGEDTKDLTVTSSLTKYIKELKDKYQ